MRTIDFSPLYRSFIGSDRLASLVESARLADSQSTFPPYNIELLGEDKYQISMAVAGFSRDEITLESRENTLTVTGEKPSDDKDASRKFLHKGISQKNFSRRFQLGDHVKVSGAAMTDGLLHIQLERVVPESKKPRKIDITSR